MSFDKFAFFLCTALTVFYFVHGVAEQTVYTQSLFGYRDMYYGANFTTGDLDADEPVQPFTLTLWLTGSGISVPYETMHGYCNTFEHYASSQYTYIDGDGDGYYALEDSASFYDNGSSLFEVNAVVMAVANVTTTSAVKVWSTNAFDGFFGIYAALTADPRPVNRSVVSVLLRRTCEDGYTANAGYITYGGIHSQCDVTAYTPTDNGKMRSNPSVRITTIRHGKNKIDGRSCVATLDSLEQNIVLPKEVFDKLDLKATHTERGFTVDCDSRPEIAISFNGTGEFVITARELMYKASDGRCYLQVSLPETDPMDPENSANATYILGLPFLRQFCVAFDLENSKMGIGSHKAEVSNEICHYHTPLSAKPQRQCAAMKRQIPSSALSSIAVSRWPLVVPLLAVVVSLSPCRGSL